MGHNIWLEDPPIKSQSKPLVDVSTLIWIEGGVIAFFFFFFCLFQGTFERILFLFLYPNPNILIPCNSSRLKLVRSIKEKIKG